MPERSDDLRLSRALRDGLCALPVPEASPDFDARILAALRSSQPWRYRLWQPAKPLLLGASCSLTVTLLALHWTLSAPMMAPHTPPMGEPERPVAAIRAMPSLDALLERPNLSAGSLAVWASPPTPNSGGAGTSDPSKRRPEPHRRAQLLRCTVLIV